MPAHRSTSLLSIKAAHVKAGEVVVPVMTAVGEWTEISATPATWAALAFEVKAAQAGVRRRGFPRLGQDGQPKSPILKPGTGKLL